MLQLSRQGAVVALPADERDSLQGAWRRDHYVLLPRFLDTPLLEFVRAHVRRAGVYDNVHPESGRETTMADNAAVWLLDFLMNAPELLEQVGAITGCGHVRRFHGRVYQLTPGTDEGHDWHADFVHGRRLGVSVNLTDHRFQGGVLQLRHVETHALFGELANTGAGDCVIFRLGEDIEHRVLPVTGTVPRLAYAGWFHEGPTQIERLKALQSSDPTH